MLVLWLVKEVDKAYDILCIEIVPTIEKLSLHMREACQVQQLFCHFTVWGKTVWLEGSFIALYIIQYDVFLSGAVMIEVV